MVEHYYIRKDQYAAGDASFVKSVTDHLFDHIFPEDGQPIVCNGGQVVGKGCLLISETS